MNKIISLTLAVILLCLPATSLMADQTVTLTATAPGQSFIGLPSGNTYKADNQGNINNVHASDVPSLLKAGATIKAGGTSITGTPGDVANFGSGGALQDSGSTLGTAAFQPTTAFDASGAAAAVQSYFTGQTGFLSCNGSGCTASPTVPASSVSGLGSAAVQPSAAFDASGAASTVKSYFTGLSGFLSCNGSGCTAASTIPATSVSGLGTAALQPSTAFDAVGAAAAVSATSATKAVRGVTQSNFFDGVPTQYSRGSSGNIGTANDPGGTSRLLFVAQTAMHDPRLLFMNYIAYTGLNLEGPSVPNPVTYSASIEPTGAAAPIPETFAGKKYVTLAPGGKILGDALGLEIPAGNVFVRTRVQIALAPTSPAVTAGTGGSLAAATYYYKITELCGDQGESGPSTEVNAVVSASGTATLGWGLDSRSVPTTAINIYRGTATGTEKLVATLPPNTTAWTDTGALTPGTQSPPASAQVYPTGMTARGQSRSGEGANYVSVAGNGSDQLLTTGTSWFSTAYTFVAGPNAILAKPNNGSDVVTIDLAGDSIFAGSGDIEDRGIMAYALMNRTPYIGYFMGAVSGDLLSNALTTSTMQRRLYATGSTDVITDYLINDINSGNYTLSFLQGELVQWWQILNERAPHVWQVTHLPRTGSTNNWSAPSDQVQFGATVAGATNATPIVLFAIHNAVDGTYVKVAGVGGNTAANGNFYVKVTGYDSSHCALYTDAALTMPVAGNGTFTTNGQISRPLVEAVREGLNSWYRAGAPLASTTNLTAVAVGTAGALVAGQPGHPLYGVIDLAGPLEVNASNVVTPNGGFWLTNGSAATYTGDGTHPSTASDVVFAATFNPSIFPTP